MRKVLYEILVSIFVLLFLAPVQIFGDNNQQFYKKSGSESIQSNDTVTKNKTIIALDSTAQMKTPNWKKDKVVTPRDYFAPLQMRKRVRTIDPARDEREAAIERINQIRAEVFTGHKLVWDANVANSSQYYVNQLVKTGKYDHRSGFSECMWPSYSPIKFIDAINRWYKEKPYYRYANDPCFPCTGGECGHYTAMIWKNTAKFGCGKGVYQTGKYKGATLVICQCVPLVNYTCQKPY